MAPCNLVVSNPMVTCSNPMVSLSNHGWCARPSFDPRNKSEGMQAHVWTAPAVQEEFGVDAKWGASHVFGLLLRH